MSLARRAALLAFSVATAVALPAAAEPTDPVVIGWWSYFTPEGGQYQVPTTDPAHPVTSFGDPDTYYYEPSGGHGLQEDPSVLPPDQAWQNIISFVLSNTNGATLSPDFSIDTSSDLSQWTQAYFGWAFVLLYVPKDQYCDAYRIHIGAVDDGVEALANAKILGYKNIGEAKDYIDMVEDQTSNLVLRPGINEIVIIHEDQAAVQRYVHDVWIEHNGVQIPLAPKNIIWGQVTDAASKKPLYQTSVGLTGNGVTDTFGTGPFGFYFFDNLADGSYALTADGAGYKTGNANAAVALGQGATEVVRTDIALDQGCECPSGKQCGPSGGCLDPCVTSGELGETCADPAATCVDHACVKDPCDTLTCAPGFSCKSSTAGDPPVAVGTCVEDACSNVCCGAGEICSAGACVPDNCAGACAAGQTCAGGNCVDACTVISCVAPLVCVQGVCEPKCVADPSSCGGGFDGGLPAFDAGGGSGGSGGSGGADGGSGTGGGGGSGAGLSRGGTQAGSSSGCGCRVPSQRPAQRAPAELVLGLLALLALRRRRERA